MYIRLYQAGESAPPDLYRDLCNGQEIRLPIGVCLPVGPDGKPTCYVHLRPSFERAREKKDEFLGRKTCRRAERPRSVRASAS